MAPVFDMATIVLELRAAFVEFSASHGPTQDVLEAALGERLAHALMDFAALTADEELLLPGEVPS